MKEEQRLPGMVGAAGEDWLAFFQQCQDCQNCNLASGRTKVVVGRGALHAPLLIIGEGPGAEEDHMGLPFVGRSGRLLTYLLEALSMTPRDFHIANIVKCRPPENRAPFPEEVAACRPLLLRQFDLVGGRVVLTLGATAYRYFTGLREPVTKIRGQWIYAERENLWIMPSLHPAYILRNGTQRPKLWEDLILTRLKLEELGQLPPLATLPPMPTDFPKNRT